MKFRNNFLLCLLVSFLIIMTVGVAFADEAPAMELVETGTVSGDAHIESANPWKTSGSVEYIIPDNVDEIKSAYAVVNSYSGSGAPTYALYSNITLNTSNGFEVLGYEDLYSEFSMTNDPLVYVVNNHTTKQYSDYQSVFNITEKVKNLPAGEKITVSVENTKKEGYNFDARIKLISIILIYDDGDNDKINYWLNIGQSWTQSTRSNLINTKDFKGEYDEVTFENIGLSTYNALCRINNKLIYDPIYEKMGSYFVDDIWNITNNFQMGQDTNFSYKASTNGYGSFKSNIQLLKVVKSYLTVTTSITPQYKDTIFAGVSNNLTINVKSSQDLNATVKLYNNKNLVFNEQVSLKNGINQKLYFIDSKIRPITANTVNGAKNTYENYTLVIEDSAGNKVNSTDVSYVVLYNGNLGKDLAYPVFNGTVNRVYNITGDVVVLTQNDSVYAGSGATNLECTFDVGKSDVVESLLYVSYNWDKIASGDFNSWNIAFNGKTIAPVASYRDQSNLGTYGRYGYGLVVYNVTALVKSGANKLVLNKDAGGSAVYPPSLVLLTDNDKNKTFKTVYIAENADLLSKPANIESGSFTFMDVDTTDLIKSTLYVFAASAQSGESNIVFNEKTYSDVWNGSSNSLNYFMVDITKNIKENNKIYFESTGSTILALPEIIVCQNKGPYTISASIAPPYANTVFAGVNNTLTVEIVNGNKAFDGSVKLLAGGKEVASSDLKIAEDSSKKVTLIDTTIRPVDKSTVNGESNKKEDYTLLIVDKFDNILNSTNASFNVLYNGNLGKDLAYPAFNATVNRVYNITGDVVVLTQDDSVYAGSDATNLECTFDVGKSDVVESLLYVSYNWDKIASGDFNSWNIAFNGKTIAPVASYRDQSNLGTYGRYGYGLVVYNVTALVKSGDNKLVLNKDAGGSAVYPPSLVLLTDNSESTTYKLVYIAENADLLSKPANIESGSYTFMDVETINLLSSQLYVFAASAQSGEGNIIINDKPYNDVWSGTSNSLNYFMINSTDDIKNNNKIYFQATGSTILALHQIIVCEKSLEFNTISATITPPYANTVFAGVNNTLTVDIVNGNKAFDGSVKLLAGGKEIASSDLSLKSNSTGKVTFVDKTIRPIDKSTVNGEKNKKEDYTLLIVDKFDNVLNSTSASFNVLYNGNLGKDLAYPAFNGTVNRVYNITGDVVVLTQDDSVYAGSSATGLESTFNVKDSGVVEALLYVSYNWDKVASGDFNSWNIAFNGKAIAPVANYRDQSNLGTYGRYGYGLVVYNVTALVKSGANKLVLNKDAGGSAVYPPSLVLLTDNSKSITYKLVYIAENADLLSKPANIESGSYTFMDVKSDDSIKSTLYVFAAGAQAGEANVVVNEKGYNNIWNGTSNSLNYHLIDMTNSILKSNKIYFQATGSTILSLHDILVVEFEKITPQLNLSAEDITVGENVNIDVVLPQDATGNVTLNNSTISIKNGKATFVISNLDVGDYKFIVRYSGDDKYNPTSNSVNVHVKENKSVNLTVPEVQKYYKGPERLYVYLKDYNGKPISNASISIKLNGVSYNRQTDKNGVVSMGLGLDSNEYDVDVAFNGSEKYNSAKTTSKVIIKPTVNGTDVVKVFRNGTQYYATFRDSTGKYLANGTKIQFNINGVLYTRSINGDKGLAKLNINLPQGEYVITATNVETGENAANNIKVISRIVENNDLTKYYRNSSQYTVKIIGDDGKAVGKGVEVKFNINGVFYYRTTNESGIAKLNLNLQPGDYIITAEYGDCRVSNNIKILPVLSASDLKMSYRDGSSFKAKLLDGKGIPLANEKIQFNVNGVFYTRTTDSTGVARLNINLMAGEYIITSSYNGANIANTISIRG